MTGAMMMDAGVNEHLLSRIINSTWPHNVRLMFKLDVDSTHLRGFSKTTLK